MRVLALEPYFGGSHKAFLEGWSEKSRHHWTVLGLPARKWKWRMHHGAWTFGEEVKARDRRGERWELLLASDMLNLAELKGLLPARVRDLPALCYFHENQLTYPDPHQKERDYHFGFVNLSSALAADAVWFNSRFHRESFLNALDAALKRMPDHRSRHLVERVRQRSSIKPQGFSPLPPRPPRRAGPLRILWVSRWEHDKDPQSFFEALRLLKEQGVCFRLSVLGQSFRGAPEIFARSRHIFAREIDHFGFIQERAAYLEVLLQADVVVSTARHEFFGIGVAEAVAAGAWPLVPEGLAYTEILHGEEPWMAARFFHQRQPSDLAARLQGLAARLKEGGDLTRETRRTLELVLPYTWPRLRPRLDLALEEVARNAKTQGELEPSPIPREQGSPSP